MTQTLAQEPQAAPPAEAQAAKPPIPADFKRIPAEHGSQLNPGDLILGQDVKGKILGVVIDRVTVDPPKLLVRWLWAEWGLDPKGTIWDPESFGFKSDKVAKSEVWRAPDCCRWAQELWKAGGNPTVGGYSPVPGEKLPTGAGFPWLICIGAAGLGFLVSYAIFAAKK